jgi:hypothetical protein
MAMLHPSGAYIQIILEISTRDQLIRRKIAQIKLPKIAGLQQVAHNALPRET